jgi:hypothetical protein
VDHGVYLKDYPDMQLKAKSQKFTLDGMHLFEIDHGKFARVTTYFNEEDFMKQMRE